MSHCPPHTKILGWFTVSKPVPEITRGEPPPKLPLDGEMELISRVDVKMVMLSETPRRGLWTTTG